jgi:mono/diheme cytochrome c family protein
MKSYLTIGGIAVMMVSCAAAPPAADAGDPTTLPPASAPESPPPPEPEPVATNRTVWDGVYTLAQAERGQGIAQEQCSMCHSVQGEWPVLFGLWTGRSLLPPFTTISSTMPQHNPGGLQMSEYAAVMAYILQLNGAPAGSSELPSDDDALGQIMVTRR